MPYKSVSPWGGSVCSMYREQLSSRQPNYEARMVTKANEQTQVVLFEILWEGKTYEILWKS